MDPSRTPVIVGAGQVTNHIQNVETDHRPPLDLILDAARAALADAQMSSPLTGVDLLSIAKIIGWNYLDPTADVAAGLGLTAARRDYTAFGGNSPQRLVNEAAAAIGAGEIESALLLGGEAFASRRKAHRIGFKLPWPKDEVPDRAAEYTGGCTPYELSHGLILPTQNFAMFENALRARAGESIAEHQRKLGEQCAAFSRVAARHPNAWFPQARTAEEIRTVTDVNRMVAFPYPKYMCAVLEVDQAAGVLVCSAAKAQALGIPEDRWVYVWGGADYPDGEFMTTKVNYHTSPAARACGAQALAQAGMSIDDVKYVDLYSCFPCVPQLGARELGLADRPWDALTLTGGLPYFGGPGNNYSMHAVATLVDRLREDPDATGLIYAIGYWAAKQSVGVYGGRPQPAGYAPVDPAPYAAQLAAEQPPPFTETPDGRVTVETYSVAHGRSGEPETGFVFGRLDDGTRCFGVTGDAAMLEWMETHEAVGAAGHMRAQDGRTRFELTEG